MLTRSLDKARAAFKTRDVARLREAHQPSDHQDEPHRLGGQQIKSLVYGGLDGIITTFAIVAGVTGASLSSGVVLILGFANLIADGLSMAIGDYLSTQAENEYAAHERLREEWEVKHYPEGERLETIELYVEKGMEQQDAEHLTDILSKYQSIWIDTMMAEELGILESTESPIRNAIVTFISFATFGCVPLLAFVFAYFISQPTEQTIMQATLLTALTLFGLGVLKVRFTNRNWFVSGIEMLLIGGIAAGAAYGIGFLLSGIA